MKNIKQANLNIKLKDFYRKWLEITKPFHKLRKQEQDVLALFLYYYYKFSKEITNNKILWKVVFDYDTKQLIKEELDIKDQGLQNILTQLRKKGIIKNNQVLSIYIPELEVDSKNFKVIFNFNIVHE